MEINDSHRLRQRPDERFAGPQHRFDLDAVAAHLHQEAGAGAAGHRQESLYKQGPTSIALFLFKAGSRLAPHRTNGTVLIHVVKGRLVVNAEGQVNDLGAGNILVLRANVQHEVQAPLESEMLLTVHLEPRPPASD